MILRSSGSALKTEFLRRIYGQPLIAIVSVVNQNRSILSQGRFDHRTGAGIEDRFDPSGVGFA
jgi:hypothetical protein